jgi:spermidine synthase
MGRATRWPSDSQILRTAEADLPLIMDVMQRLALPCALFCSGFAALAVEVLWQRLLTPVLGGSTLAVTAVLIAYMGGLALGAGLAGRVGDRLSPHKALQGYRLLELLVWLAATATTLVLTVLPVGVAGVLSDLPEGTARFVVRFLMAAGLLLLPTTAMGATLPLAVRALAGSGAKHLLGKTALLYTANTAGAVAGAMVGPLLLLPHLGLKRSVLLGATGSLLAFGLAAFARPWAEGEEQENEEAETGETGRFEWGAVLMATFAMGGTSLGFEVIWTRALGTVAGSTVYAFGVVLALVLGGIALGSAGVSLLGTRVFGRRAAMMLMAALCCLAPLLSTVLMELFDRIPLRFADLTTRGAMTFASELWVVISVGAWVILPPTLCFGAALPLAVRAARSQSSKSAKSVSSVYVANTLGALLGAAGTGLVLMPRLGQGRAGLALSVLPLMAGLFVWAARATATVKQGIAGVLVVGAVAGVIGSVPRPSSLAAAAGIHSNRKRTRVNVVYYAEGPEASALVESNGAERSFYVAGRPEASSYWYDVRTQYLLGHLAAMVVGGARNSLVIGMGSGMTAGALATYGDVTIAELNRAVPGATAQFRDYNHDVLTKARITIEDGRVALTKKGARFDVITTDPIHPYVAGSASLYTTEHLRLSRDHLGPNGAVTLWIPLHRMGQAELRAIVGSFVDVFPNAELYLIHNDVVLLGGGRGGKRSGADRLAMFREGWTPVVAEDLRKARLFSPEELANIMVAGPDALARYVAGARRNRDDDPWIEFSLPLFVHKDTRGDNLETLLALRDPAQAQSPLGVALASTLWSYLTPTAGRALAVLHDGLHDGQAVLAEQRMAIRESSAELALQLWRAGSGCKSLALARAEAENPDATIESLLSAEEVFHNDGDWAAVTQVTDRLKKQWSDRPEGYLWAGDALVRQARFDEAVPELERAAALDPFRGYAVSLLRGLSRAYLMTGQSEKGRAALAELLTRDASQTDMASMLSATPAQLSDMRREAENQQKQRERDLELALHPL